MYVVWNAATEAFDTPKWFKTVCAQRVSQIGKDHFELWGESSTLADITGTDKISTAIRLKWVAIARVSDATTVDSISWDIDGMPNIWLRSREPVYHGS